MFKKHWHIETLSDCGFSVSARFWETEADAERQRERIARHHISWLIEHSHHEGLHEHMTVKKNGW